VGGFMKKQMTQTEQACIDIYMCTHVSRLSRLGIEITRAWKIGKKLYCDRADNIRNKQNTRRDREELKRRLTTTIQVD
jgi:hypothetical protein